MLAELLLLLLVCAFESLLKDDKDLDDSVFLLVEGEVSPEPEVSAARLPPFTDVASLRAL